MKGRVYEMGSARGEIHDSLVIFQQPKERGNGGVVSNIARYPLLHVYVCFVKEENGTEGRGDV